MLRSAFLAVHGSLAVVLSLSASVALAQGAPPAIPVDMGRAGAPTSTVDDPNLTRELERYGVSSAPAGPPLSLDQALSLTLTRHPALGQARANTQATEARTGQALAPLLPQLTGQAYYARATANYVPRAGQYVPPTPQSETFESHSLWNFGLTLNQLIFDFGQTSGRWRAAQANADAQRSTEQATRLTLSLNLRTSYFQARAQKALRDVARATLVDQDRHLALIKGFVEVGTRAMFDLAQVKSARQSALLSVVNADNSYRLARVQLAQAMGLEARSDFEVGEDTMAPVPEEGATSELLFSRALASRPDLKAALAVVRADERTLRAFQGGYGPSIGLLGGFNEQGSDLKDLRWNWNGQVTITWQLFQGGITRSQVAEAEANGNAARAQVQLLRLQLMVLVEQARVGVSGAKQALATASILVENTREQLRLAEGRYQTGAGSLIELEDAQLSLQTASGQEIQSELNLATARAQLRGVLALP